jgi:hypothetical protein
VINLDGNGWGFNGNCARSIGTAIGLRPTLAEQACVSGNSNGEQGDNGYGKQARQGSPALLLNA